jgi:hypothetical protein
MVEYPKAFLTPFVGGSSHEGGQRSDAEANRLVRWLLDNGIEVRRSDQDFTWRGTTYPAGSYVVPMNQAFRGLTYTALAAGQDISERINQLYAHPRAPGVTGRFGGRTSSRSRPATGRSTRPPSPQDRPTSFMAAFATAQPTDTHRP